MSFNVEIIQKGVKIEVLAEQILPKLCQRLVERLAEAAYTRAVEEAPRRTGKLAQSITKTVRGYEAIVEATAPYAVYVERGTRPHVIRPVRAKALRFEVDGETVYAKIVHHPGTLANPFMARAADYTRSQIGNIFAALWRQEVGG